jgi:phosphohistidine phosphatase
MPARKSTDERKGGRTLELILVRHAVAFERDRARWPDDRMRPLTPAGRRKFRKVAAGVVKWLGPVDCLLTSPLIRAQQTAALLTQCAHWPEPIDCPELAPHGGPAAVLAALREKKARRIALVGHEPDLGLLVSECLGKPDAALPIRLKKGAVACISFVAEPRAGGGTLTALVPPRALRRMR